MKRIGIIVQCKECNINDSLACDFFNFETDKVACECCGSKRLRLDVYIIEYVSANNVDYSKEREEENGKAA